MASLWRHPKSKYWTACYTDHTGRQKKRSTKKTDRDEALVVALEYERAERSARDGMLTMEQCRKVLSDILEKTTGESIRTQTTSVYFQEWLKGKEASKSPGTVQRYRSVANLFVSYLGEKAKRPLMAVATRDVQGFLNLRLTSGSAPKTVRVDAKTLHNAFNRAVITGLILTNPVKAVELPKVVSSKRKTFTHAQIGMLVEAAPSQDWKTTILLGYYIGARLQDCVCMKWENVDLAQGVIRYQPQKTGASEDGEETWVEVPIHPELEAHLSKLASSDSPEEYLCPSLAGKQSGGAHGLSQAFKAIMKKAGIDSQTAKGKGVRRFSRLSFHSLRHSFNSALTNAGVDQETRMKLTGHKSSTVNAGYTHHELEPLRAAISKLPTLNAETKQ